LSRNTIRRGQRELLRPPLGLENRIRRKGGGRLRIEKKRYRSADCPRTTDARCHRRRSDEGVEVDA
jgi:hypothetical protein